MVIELNLATYENKSIHSKDRSYAMSFGILLSIQRSEASLANSISNTYAGNSNDSAILNACGKVQIGKAETLM
jgi:hypothetical protein